MKTTGLFLLCLLGTLISALPAQANKPDSVFLYTYGTSSFEGRGGLRAAWSPDQENWNLIGANYSFVGSDYGVWGREKRMISPCVLRGQDGDWHLLFSVNEYDGVLAHASSPDLIHWKPQNYYTLMPKGENLLRISARYSPHNETYTIDWLSGNETQGYRLYSTRTKDFKTYTEASEVIIDIVENIQNLNPHRAFGQEIPAVMPTAWGTVTKVPYKEVHDLTVYVGFRNARDAQYHETPNGDARKFANLEPLTATLSVGTGKTKDISSNLIGIFFEDISRAADGGIYAELIQNRDFEYSPADKKGSDPNWNATYAWTLDGTAGAFEIATNHPIHVNNPHYAVLRADVAGAVSLRNKGFEGIAVKKGEKYTFSVFAKHLAGKTGKLQVSLLSNDGNQTLATATLSAAGLNWKKQTISLTANADAADAILQIRPLAAGTTALDMISLFPKNTFKGRENGLRADLAQHIADMKPRFVRFPGGCVAHGDGLDNMYRWKQTIGPLEARKPQPNIWGYHQTSGLGYYEYFLFCEDLGAIPLPVLPAAVPCQNSSTGGAGQQGGVPMEDMDEYIQEVLDLIEYANGDPRTTKWGKVRAQSGHPASFNLKYLGIGNEDLISDVFKERFEMIYKAIQEKHPEIVVIGTAGPFWEGSDYEEGWRFATQLDVPMVDEHYYVDPGWYIHNQNFYDNYDRSKARVYLGEYASRGNTLYNALAEAMHLCNIERNGDIVEMTSYAPLLAKEGQTNWNPNLIYFTNTEVKPTVNYYVQKLFGQYSGTKYIGSALQVESRNPEARQRVVSSVVQAENGDIFVRLVNILPTTVSTKIALPEGLHGSTQATKYVLTGDPRESNQKPTRTAISFQSGQSIELPPYSFTMIRLMNYLTANEKWETPRGM